MVLVIYMKLLCFVSFSFFKKNVSWPKFCNIIFLILLKIGSVVPVDQQISLISPNKDLREQWKCTNWKVVLFIKKMILFKNWSDISFFETVRKCSIFKIFINAIGTIQKSPPKDLLLLRSLITCFTSFTKTG